MVCLVRLLIQPGTFLSDSEAGGVSVTWIAGEQHHIIVFEVLFSL